MKNEGILGDRVFQRLCVAAAQVIAGKTFSRTILTATAFLELFAQMHQEPREADLVQAEPLLREELARRGWAEGDPDKVEIVSQLRPHATMTLKRIAHRLRMSAWTHASNCLVQKGKNNQKCQ